MKPVVPGLVVPGLVVVAGGCLWATVAMSDAHLHRESAACRWMAVPWTQFAVAYAVPAAAALALLAHVRLLRTGRRVSVVAAVLAGLLMVAGLGGVWLTHSQAAESAANQGRPMCEGAAPHR